MNAPQSAEAYVKMGTLRRILDGLRSPVRRSMRLELLMLFALGTAIRCIWAFIVPPWLGPDEMAHFTYAAYIVENQNLPQFAAPLDAYPDQPAEATSSCLQTLCNRISALSAPRGREMNYLPVGRDFRSVREYRASSPEARKSYSGSSAASYPPVYYLVLAPFYWAFLSAPILSRLLALRVATACLSALAGVFAYLMAYEAKRDRGLALQVGLMVALAPMMSFVGACVNNDGVMFAATSAVCWLTVRLARRPTITLADGAALGVASSLILLTKPTGVPVIGMSLAFMAVKATFTRGKPLSTKFGGTLVCLVLLIAFQGGWLIARRLNPQVGVSAPGELGLLSVLQGGALHSFGEYLTDLFGARGRWYFWFLFKSFWALFGWQEIPLRDSYYRAVFIVCGVGGLAFILDLARRKLSAVEVWLFLTVVVHVAGLFIIADYLLAFATRGGSYGMQGRYFLPILPPLIYVVTASIQSLAGERRLLSRLLPLGMVLLQLASLATIIDAYYGVDIE